MERYFGVYRGNVVNNLDPLKLGRLQVRVLPIYLEIDDKDLVWAEGCFPYGGSPENGIIFIPEIGSQVLVQFEAGNPNRPIWMGTFFGMPKNINELPKITQGIPGQPESIDSEPLINTAFAAVYPQNKTIKTKNGIVVELDDTEANRRINLYHPSGSKLEFRENGDVVFHVKGDLNIVVDKNKEELIKLNDTQNVLLNQTKIIGQNQTETVNLNKTTAVMANNTLTVQGAQNETVYGEKNEVVLGQVTESYASGYNQSVAGNSNSTISGLVNVEIAQDYNILTGGARSDIAGGNMTLKGSRIDLN